MISRLAYRSRQFWNALLSPNRRIPSESLRPYLTPALLILFRRMQPAEQAHAYQVFKRLEQAGQSEADLLGAALLHDVGKILFPLSIFDRGMIVAGKRLFPKLEQRWGEGPARGLRRPFVVAENHAAWGADLAAQAGASERAVELIRRHHEAHALSPNGDTARLLAALLAADEQS